MAITSTANDIRAGGVFLEIEADSSDAVKKANDVEERYKKMVKQLKSDFNGMKSLFSEIVSGAKDIAKPIISYDSALHMLKGTLQLTNKELEKFDKYTRGMSGPYDPTQIISIMTELGRAGLTQEQVLNAALPIAKLSKLTGADTILSTQLITNLTASYQLNPEDMSALVDKLAMAANASELSLEELKDSVKYAAMTARVADIPIEQMLADISAMSNLGLKGSTAGTSYARLIRSLASEEKAKLLDSSDDSSDTRKEIKELNEILKSLDIKTVDERTGNLRSPIDVVRELESRTSSKGNAVTLGAFHTIFGDRGMLSAVSLAEASYKVDELLEKINSSTGYVDKAVKDIEDSMESQITTVIAQFQRDLNSLVKEEGNNVKLMVDAFEELTKVLTDNMPQIVELLSRLVPLIASYVVFSRSEHMFKDLMDVEMLKRAGASIGKIAGRVMSMTVGGFVANLGLDLISDATNIESPTLRVAGQVGGQAVGFFAAEAIWKTIVKLGGVAKTAGASLLAFITALGTAKLAILGIAASIVSWIGYEAFGVLKNKREEARKKEWENQQKRMEELRAKTLERKMSVIDYVDSFRGNYESAKRNAANDILKFKDKPFEEVKIKEYYNDKMKKVSKDINYFLSNLNSMLKSEDLDISKQEKEEIMTTARGIAKSYEHFFREQLSIYTNIVDAQVQAAKKIDAWIDSYNTQFVPEQLKNLISVNEMLSSLDEEENFDRTRRLKKIRDDLKKGYSQENFGYIQDSKKALADTVSEELSTSEKIDKLNSLVSSLEKLYSAGEFIESQIESLSSLDSLRDQEKDKLTSLTQDRAKNKKDIEEQTELVESYLRDLKENISDSIVSFGSFDSEDVAQKIYGLVNKDMDKKLLSNVQAIKSKVSKIADKKEKGFD